MQYSEVTEQTGGHTHFSPDGRLVASAAAYRLLIRDVDTLQIVQLFSCVDTIDRVEWSSDSLYVLCGIFKRGFVQVWSVTQPEWHCKIDEGPVGLAFARWAPDGRHILAAADFQLRVTIWSLLDRSVFYIKYPKFAREGMSFSSDGGLMALAHRKEGRDSVQIFECDGWSTLRSFAVATQDLADLRWAPAREVLCVIDSLLEYQVLLYSAGGEQLGAYRAHDYGLGVKAFSWSPSGQLLALGSFDERARLLTDVTWQPIAELEHPTDLRPSFAPDAVAFIEPATPSAARPPPDDEKSEAAADVELFLSEARAEVGYIAQRLPLHVPALKPNPDKAHPKVGVGLVEWSSSGRYLASRNENMPCALWVWDCHTLVLHSTLLQQQAIRAAAWHPKIDLLALCCGGGAVYMWSPQGCRTAPLPPDRPFRVSALKWNSSGDALALLDREHFCICYIPISNDTLL